MNLFVEIVCVRNNIFMHDMSEVNFLYQYSKLFFFAVGYWF